MRNQGRFDTAPDAKTCPVSGQLFTRQSRAGLLRPSVSPLCLSLLCAFFAASFGNNKKTAEQVGG